MEAADDDMGAAASTGARVDLATASDEVLSEVFAELDVDRTGHLPIDLLVFEAKAYFDSQPTSQPETWIRSMIMRCDQDEDGYLNLDEFNAAIAALRKC